MNDILTKVAVARQGVKDAEETIKNIESELEKHPLYVLFLEEKHNLSNAKKAVDELEDTARKELAKDWKQGQPKKYAGYSIREYRNVILKDEKKAKMWAAQNAPSTLKLTADFAKKVEELELDFVEVEIEPKAALDSDLSSWLPMVEPLTDENDDNAEFSQRTFDNDEIPF